MGKYLIPDVWLAYSAFWKPVISLHGLGSSWTKLQFMRNSQSSSVISIWTNPVRSNPCDMWFELKTHQQLNYTNSVLRQSMLLMNYPNVFHPQVCLYNSRLITSKWLFLVTSTIVKFESGFHGQDGINLSDGSFSSNYMNKWL